MSADDSSANRCGWAGAASRLLVLGLLLIAFQGWLHAQAQRPETAALDPRAVAVIPFSNISGDPADDWIGAGIAETVTADLERLGSLSIAGREAVLSRSRQQGLDASEGDETVARELGSSLGVSWIVAGGFQHVGNQLRITARVVEVETGAIRQTVKVDGELDELFALQDRIVAELGRGFDLFTTGRPARMVAGVPTREGERVAREPAAPSADAPEGRPGPGGPGGRPPEAGAAPPGLTPEGVTGGIAFDSNEPQFGVASGAGILTGRPTVRPTRAPDRPNIDGRLDDAVWRSAAKITDFVQSRPLDGAPATEDTEVWIAYDNANIYFAFHLHYSDPTIMRANRVDRDRAFQDDRISVYFDTFLDQQRAYSFNLNAYGVQGDQIINARGGGGFGGPGGGRGGGGRRGGGGGGFPGRGGAAPFGDRSWDTVFDSGAQIVDDGFTAEMAIPFKSLRYPQREGDTPHRWGFQIVREIQDKDNETDVWSPVSRDVAGFLPQMGVLDGMTNLSTSRNLEILPTFTAINFGSLDTATGNFDVQDTSPEGGINFKYGVTSNLTADFTINPDFSQIESDRPQIEANQRFALFFSELRPFFLEGAEIFSIQAPVTFVHTRTIVDPLYGAKLTGKVGKTTVGVLFANDEAPGFVDDRGDPAFDQSAQTFIGRVRYDLYSESHVGVIATNRDFLDSHSRLAGVDSNFRLGRTHSMGFSAIGTQHRDLDGVDTSGHLLDANFRKTGRNLSYFASAYSLSPDFQSDVGFVRRVDQRRVDGGGSFTWWPEHWLISWGPAVNYGRNWNFDGVLEDENRQAGVDFSFARNLAFRVGYNRDMERFGGINFDKNRYMAFGRVNTSRVFSVGGGFNWGDQIFFDETNPFLGRDSGLFSFINIRPISQFNSQININTSRFTDPANSGAEIFDVKIFRALSTYQFTDRLLFRNITEFNTFDKAIGLNFLVTYRVNALTVFYVGYDDHYQQAERLFGTDGDVDGDGIRDPFYDPNRFEQTNRAFFLKFRYLFRL